METWKKYKPNWIPRAVLILLYLTMLSVWWLSGLSARFVTGANADDNARVAAFNVTGDGTMSRSFVVIMKPGDGVTGTAQQGTTGGTTSGEENKDISVTVKNSSETAVSYKIAFYLNGNLPITVTLGEDETSSTTADPGSTKPGTAVATAETVTTGTTTSGANDLTKDSGELVWQRAAAMAGDKTTYKFHLKWADEDNGYQFSEGIESIIVEVTAMQED